MRINPRLLDHAAEHMTEYAEWRKEQRIRMCLGLRGKGSYARTWIGSLPVYLGENRMWVPCSNWLFAKPRPLCTPVKVPVSHATDRLVRVRPNVEVVHHNPAWKEAVEAMKG